MAATGKKTGKSISKSNAEGIQEKQKRKGKSSFSNGLQDASTSLLFTKFEAKGLANHHRDD